MEIPLVIVALGVLVFIAHGLEDIFVRTKITDVLILMFIGLALGPATGLVSPDDLGKFGPVFTTLTLIVILFEGGLRLDLKILGRSLVGATGLTVWSFLLTLVVIAPIAKAFIGLSWLESFMLASALGGTSSAMVIPVVKRLALGEKTKTVLALESALSDVLMIVVALGLITAYTEGVFKFGQLFGGMFVKFAVAAGIGGLSGLLWSLALSRLHALKKSIFTTPAFVLVVYGLVELLGFSGAIAALVMGITLGNICALPPFFLRNRRDLLSSPSVTELAVFEEVAFLLKTFFFVYVGISIQLKDPLLIFIGIALTIVLFIVRIPVIHVSLFPSKSYTRFEAAISGAMNPKGLAAAVVASMPLQYGIEKGQVIQHTAFAIILFSVIAASLLVFLIEHGWFNTLGKMFYYRYRKNGEEVEKNDEDNTISN